MDKLAHLALRHRRLLAALCAGLAVLLGLGALKTEPPGRIVVAAARDLPSGTVLGASDVHRVRLPEQTVPSRSATRPAQVVGRTVAGPMRRGEVLTDTRVVDADHLAGRPPGTVLATIRLADADALASLRVGDRVDVVAVQQDESEATVVARGVEIVTIPRDAADSGGVPVSVATTEDAALRLAERALDARLTVIAARH